MKFDNKIRYLIFFGDLSSVHTYLGRCIYKNQDITGGGYYYYFYCSEIFFTKLRLL